MLGKVEDHSEMGGRGELASLAHSFHQHAAEAGTAPNGGPSELRESGGSA